MIKQKQKVNFLDISGKQKKDSRNTREIDSFEDFAERINQKDSDKLKSTLFSKRKRTDFFYTEDSKLYITPKEYKLMKKGVELDRDIKKWDSLSSRVIRSYAYHSPEESLLYEKYLVARQKIEHINEELANQSKVFIGRLTVAKVWNASVVGAIIFGMFTMSLIYRYLGPSASAGEINSNLQAPVAIEETVKPVESRNTVMSNQEEKTEKAWNKKMENEYIEKVVSQLEEEENEEFKKKAHEMVKGYPIEEMLPYILEKDRIVASFLIGIGKKESNWGKRVPVLNGQDCFNYWGYRGIRKLMGTGGHTCFNSRKDAVDTVAKRIDTLVKKNKIETPKEMIIWKCGYSCAGHSDYSVKKWISDVDLYFRKLN